MSRQNQPHECVGSAHIVLIEAVADYTGIGEVNVSYTQSLQQRNETEILEINWKRWHAESKRREQNRRGEKVLVHEGSHARLQREQFLMCKNLERRARAVYMG